MVASCLPPSPLRTTFNPSGTIFNFGYQPPAQDAAFEAQLLQRLQSLSGYQPPQHYAYGYQPLLSPNVYNPQLVNNNFPPQKKMTPSPLSMRHAYSESPVLEKKSSPFSGDSLQRQQSYQQLQVNHNAFGGASPQPQRSPVFQRPPADAQPAASQAQASSTQQQKRFIKPLDGQPQSRFIVQPPDDDPGRLFATLRIGDDSRPAITRSTSEKVPNRSELMSQVQRTAWARHTTK